MAAAEMRWPFFVLCREDCLSLQLRTFNFFTAMNDSFNHNENVAGGVPGILNRVVSFFARRKCEQIYPRLLRFINEAHRDGVMGDARYAVALSKARKLERFLFIIGHPPGDSKISSKCQGKGKKREKLPSSGRSGSWREEQ